MGQSTGTVGMNPPARRTYEGRDMFEVAFTVRSPELLVPVLGQARVDQLIAVGQQVTSELDGRRVVSINSTASGGGVAEMMPVLLAYAGGAGIDGHWLVIEGDRELFAITKRLHNLIHGEPGDGGPLGLAERDHMMAVWDRNRPTATELIRSTDAVLIHDPQPTPMAQWLSELGTPVIWRCHIGIDEQNDYTRIAWDFLRPFLEPYVDMYVFTRRQYAPDWVPDDRLHVIRPALDPFSVKNRMISPADSLAILQTVGIVSGKPGRVATFQGSSGEDHLVVTPAAVVTDGLPSSDDPLVVQVSRWDALKDMGGAMQAFVNDEGCADAHLVLAGPDVSSVTDDPEGQGVLADVIALWHGLPADQRARVSIVCLSMDDPEENAIVVNALQRHARIIVQKSLKEGFGLTVTEAMYKSKPVVASAVGGIVDQIRPGVDGLLVDPHDLAATGRAIATLLADPVAAAQMGEQGHAAAVTEFMPDTSLLAWAQVLDEVVLSKLRSKP